MRLPSSESNTARATSRGAAKPFQSCRPLVSKLAAGGGEADQGVADDAAPAQQAEDGFASQGRPPGEDGGPETATELRRPGGKKREIGGMRPPAGRQRQ